MHADICDPDDMDTLQRFHRTLQRLGARREESHESATGVIVTRFRVADQHLTVFQDAWSVDIAGAEALVHQVIAEMRSEE
ncbi:MAG TPA: hypothetical protein PLZ36_14670 [Armatimonadota bacterium]|nr:hypothetical protein [Armatimonadota bacterium]